MNNLKRKSQRGITLIEMLVVVVIIGLFVGLVGVNMFKKAEDRQAHGGARQYQHVYAGAGAL